MPRRRATTSRWSSGFWPSRSSGSARAANSSSSGASFRPPLRSCSIWSRAGTLPAPVVWRGRRCSRPAWSSRSCAAGELRRALARQSIAPARVLQRVMADARSGVRRQRGRIYRIFSGLASAAIWSFAEAIVLLYIGMHGNRRAQVAGVLVVVSMIVANFTSPADVGVRACGRHGRRIRRVSDWPNCLRARAHPDGRTAALQNPSRNRRRAADRAMGRVLGDCSGRSR